MKRGREKKVREKKEGRVSLHIEGNYYMLVNERAASRAGAVYMYVVTFLAKAEFHR